VGRSLRQKRVILGSITEPLNVCKYAFRKAYKTNVYKYTSRRAYKITISSFFFFFFSFSLEHRLLYVSYRRALSLRGMSLFFTRLDASFFPSFLSLDFDDNPELIINENLYSITRFFHYLRQKKCCFPSNGKRGSQWILLYKEIEGSLDPKAPLAKISKGEIRMPKGIVRWNRLNNKRK
jgi:hypothetical protein